MRKIQKLTLSLLSLAAVSSWSTAMAADHMNIRVDRDDFATISAAYTGAYEKVNAGTVLFSGDESGITRLKIEGGKVQFNGPTEEMPQAIKFDMKFGGDTDVLEGDHVVVEVLTNGAAHDSLHSITLPTLDMQTDGDVYANSNTVVTISGLNSGSGVLNLYSGGVTDPDSIGITVPGDLSGASNAINVYGETHFGASAASKLTTGQTTVKNGGLLEVLAATAGAAPGATVVESHGMLEVAAGVNIPANGAGDVFSGTLEFENCSTLWLHNNAVWDRDITVGTPS